MRRGSAILVVIASGAVVAACILNPQPFPPDAGGTFVNEDAGQDGSLILGVNDASAERGPASADAAATDANGPREGAQPDGEFTADAGADVAPPSDAAGDASPDAAPEPVDSNADTGSTSDPDGAQTSTDTGPPSEASLEDDASPDGGVLGAGGGTEGDE